MCTIALCCYTHMDVCIRTMIDFGVIYFVLIIERLGEEITNRVYFALLSDCTEMAQELNWHNRTNPPIQAYCIPETRD